MAKKIAKTYDKQEIRKGCTYYAVEDKNLDPSITKCQCTIDTPRPGHSSGRDASCGDFEVQFTDNGCSIWLPIKSSWCRIYRGRTKAYDYYVSLIETRREQARSSFEKRDRVFCELLMKASYVRDKLNKKLPTVKINVNDFPYGKVTAALRKAVEWLNANNNRIIFAAIEAFLPKSIYNKLSPDEADFIEERTYEVREYYSRISGLFIDKNGEFDRKGFEKLMNQ